MVALAFAIPLLSLIDQAMAQNVLRRPQTPGKETYTRPKPTQPIRPEMPSQDRYVTNRVFLERADSLYHYSWNGDRQVVSGNVLFRQGNMYLYCDSAFYYPDFNSLDAFGNVKMVSGDTLHIYADKLFYDGQQRLARLKNGPSRSKVTVQNRRVTITADSLFYSSTQDRGWYENGGRLEDAVNVLTSDQGEYSPSQKAADFYGNVHLRSKRNGNQLLTDTLFYSTATNVARIVSRTDIWGTTDTIVTYSGTYNTRTGQANLTSRSTVSHTDSNHNVTKLTADIIVYDRATRISTARMFDDARGKPMVLTDTAHKTQIISRYGEYNDATRSAFATGNPLLIEYSRPDTNYMRADTIYTYVVRKNVLPDYTGEQKEILAELMEEQRRLDAEYDSLQTAYKARIEEGDTTAVEPVKTDLIASDRRLHRDSVLKEFAEATAVRHARFFNQQIQAIADTMHFRQFDSLLYLKRKPIIWSDERQVMGDTIIAHFNDSTVDRARIVGGFVAEHVAEDFYNQMKGKLMLATFADQKLKHLDVDDNVEVVLLPQEKDSTFNKIVRAESEHMSVNMNGDDLEKLKMWAAVDGTVTPLFKLKAGAQYLPGFSWQEALRPKREWYYGRWVWVDDLGEEPDDMEEYFSTKEPSENIEEYFTP